MGSSKKAKKKEKSSNKSSKRPRDSDSSNSSATPRPTKKAKVAPPNLDAMRSPHEFLEGFFLPCLKIKEHLKDLMNWMVCSEVLKKPNQCTSCWGSDLSLIDTESDDEKDRFHYVCGDGDCNKKIHIKTGSFFERLDCSIPDALLCILAWCNEEPFYLTSVCTGVPFKTVQQIFSMCKKTAGDYLIQTNALKGLVLGGADSVVLLDMWPHGYIPVDGYKREIKQSHRDRVRVLWMADTKHMPVLCWPRLLPRFSSRKELQSLEAVDTVKGTVGTFKGTVSTRLQRRQRLSKEKEGDTDQDDKDFKGSDAEKENQTRNFLPNKSNQTALETRTPVTEMKEKCNYLESPELCSQEETLPRTQSSVLIPKTSEGHLRSELLNAALSVAQDHIAKGSLILVNEDALPNLTAALLATGKYETGTSFQKLLALSEKDGQSAKSILGNIWQPAIKLCEKMKTQTRLPASETIAEFQWRHLFGSTSSTSLFNILDHIGACYGTQSIKTPFPMLKNEV